MIGKIERFAKIYPLYFGLEGDLLFYIAVDTLFLTIAKNFSAVQIVSVISIAQIICIILQYPMLFVIRKMGNTCSVRIGSLALLLSALFTTFGNSYFVILLARICHDIATVFRSVSYVALENNLTLIGKREEFVKIQTNANTAYSVITMFISFVANWMFSVNYYLPMIGCITTCTLGFILSFFIKDYSVYNKVTLKNEKGERIKIAYSKIVILVLIVYGLFYSTVQSCQTNGKIFIQQNVIAIFNVEHTALIMGVIICVSRIVRVLSNMVFAKLYKKHKAKMGVALPTVLCTAITLLLLGSFAPKIIFKICIMTIGYAMLLFVRDPFRVYVQSVLFENTAVEMHQTLMTMVEFFAKVGYAGMGMLFSAVLLKFPMSVVIAILLAFSMVEIILCCILYRMLVTNKTASPS
ncbi:MAG: hypothetical protein II995_03390 [Oscillospiraceae bacterium]|nr:hypothetical protein [Oscillospiraceae bacterium]